MAQFGSNSFAFLLAGGYDLMASKLQGFSWKTEDLTTMTHGLGDTAELPAKVGITKYTLTQSGGFFDSTANQMHDRMKAGTGSADVVCFGVAGNAVGAPFVGCLGALHTTYEVLAQNGDLTKANAAYQTNNNAYPGQVVQPWATKTADWNTKTLGTTVDYTTDPSQTVIPITSWSLASPSAVVTTVPHGRSTGDIILISGAGDINGQRTITVTSTTGFTVGAASATGGTGGSFVRANSTGGGYGFQQVSAFSGFTGFVGEIRDSADDTTYAALTTFTNVTSGPIAQSVSASGTVDRYLSYDGNVVGSGSITAMAGFCRT